MRHPAPDQARSDRTFTHAVADFSAGWGDGGVHVSASGGGELVLTPTLSAAFDGPGLPRGWSAQPWVVGGDAAVDHGVRAVGARVSANDLYGAGRALDFGATFTGAPEEDAGLGTDLESVPWALFSTRYGGRLFARSHFHAEQRNAVPGDWFGAPHHFRVDWNILNLLFWIDGEVVVTQMVPIVGFMRPLASARRIGRGGVTLHWLRLSPYARSGTFLSRVLDAAGDARWISADCDLDRPEGTAVAFATRTGDTVEPDASWSGWADLRPSGGGIDTRGRFLQYRIELATSDAMRTPAVRRVMLGCRYDPA